MTREKVRLMLLDETRQSAEKDTLVHEITAKLWDIYFQYHLAAISSTDVFMLAILSNVAYVIDDVSDSESKIDLICHVATLHKHVCSLDQQKVEEE